MPLNLRASQKEQNFNVGVCYRIGDRSGKFLDARNVNSVQDRLDTRFGTSRLNAVALPGPVKSLSYFAKSDGTKHILATVGGELYSVNESDAHDLVAAEFFTDAFHRGVTDNDRHIIAAGISGLFSWDGATFSDLGQTPPNGYVSTIAANGSLITANVYKVALTFYSSVFGFETNYIEQDPVTATNPNLQIDVSNIPTTANNGFIDTVYIYIKNVTTDSEYLFAGEVPLGTTTFTITEESLSLQVAPINNGVPADGGGQFLASFNSRTVVSGNGLKPNEVYFSEEDQPDVYNPNDTQRTLVIPGRGAVTGLAVGLFNDTVLEPFLVIFKRKSTRIYSEIGGPENRKLVPISEEIGCVSHDTIQVKNGVVYFLSEEGWRAIANGRFVTDSSGKAITLGGGDLDDIFKSTGYNYEVNRQGMARTFSVYYPTLDQYITWVSEGVNDAYTKAYVYEFETGGFKPYEFAVPATCAVIAEDFDGRDVVLFGTQDGYILKHSIMEDRSDVDEDNVETAIDAYAIRQWTPEDGDFDATYNFRELILKGVISESGLTVSTFLDYNLSTREDGEYSFSDPGSGFILDVDVLDSDVPLGDERAIVVSRSDINRVGESLAIGFYQNIIGANIGLISMQLDSSKNGNRNKSNDNDDEEGGFDDETGQYFNTVSDSVQQAQDILQEIQQLLATFTASVGTVVFSGWSNRFSEIWDSNGIQDTFEKIIQIIYAAPTITLSASPTQSVREKGTVVTSVDLTATTTKRSNDILKVRFYRAGVEVDEIDPATAGGAAETYTDNTDFSDNMTFVAQVDDDTTIGTQSNTVTYTFVYPYFSGAGAVGLSAANVAMLTKDVRVSTASLNKLFTTLNGEVYFFAYPASYGALTSILDENGFETFSDWTLRTENITGLDATPVSYRIYEFNNPVVAGSTDYTFIR